jgi:hypothetical protein
MNDGKVDVNLKKMKLADLHPAAYNPRRISEYAYDGLGKSIERFGLLAHIVWNKRSGNIVGGHQRYRQLQELGETETDVVVVDLDDSEEVALNITLNNRQVRGDFTKDVMEQLRTSEAQLGSAFRQIGLLDLYELLKGKGYEKKPKEKKDKDQKTTAGAMENDPNLESGEQKPEVIEEDKPEAIIICPNCRSQWKMKNNDVVFNAVTVTGTPVSKQEVQE